ncbi:FAD1 flavin adenine dinucleotide synthetase [Linderina pennispora]|nr:FAD1 flavin adenine dinucleotide synthetase [Linderina pennispora]
MVSRTSTTNPLDFAALSAATYGIAAQPTKFGAKVAHALEVIEEAIGTYGPSRIALSFNGGKDCTVLMHLLRAALYRTSTPKASASGRRAALPLLSLYVVSSKAFAEMDDFVEESVGRYRLQLVREGGGMRQGLEEFKASFPHVQAIFVGTRRDDPHGKSLDFFSPTDNGWPEFMRVNPVLDWSFDDIWEFIRSADVHYCGLYNQGYTSLGDVDETVRNPALCERDGVYRPAWSLKNCDLERHGRTSNMTVSPLPIAQVASAQAVSEQQMAR